MAVQAQYPSNILLLNRNVQEGKNILGNDDYSLQSQPGSGGGGGGGLLDQSHLLINNNEVGVNPRKRSREVSATPNTTITAPNMNINSFGFQLQNHHQQQQNQQNHNQNHQLIDLSQLQNHHHHQPNVVSTGLRLSFGDQNQHHLQQQQQQQQQQVLQQYSSLLSLVSEDFALQLRQQSDELNYFLHAQVRSVHFTGSETTRPRTLTIKPRTPNSIKTPMPPSYRFERGTSCNEEGDNVT